MFGGIDLRARLNRMGHPFDWSARKRRGSSGGGGGGGVNQPQQQQQQQPQSTIDPSLHQPSSAYHQYFEDDMDFPAFGAHQFDAFNRAANRKRNPFSSDPSSGGAGVPPESGHPSDEHDRSKFYDYLPQEFRQYFPESFGAFPSMRPQQSPHFSIHRQPGGGPHQTTTVPQTQPGTSPSQRTAFQQQPPQPPQPQHHVVYQEMPVTAQLPPRPKLCDAAIQTEMPGDGQMHQEPSLHHHGLRNTVDLGQKSQQKDVRQDRSHSAPPPPAPSAPHVAHAFANSGTSMTPQSNQTQMPNFQAQPTPNPKAQAPFEFTTRTVPIFIETRKAHVVPPAPPQQQAPPPAAAQHAPMQTGDAVDAPHHGTAGDDDQQMEPQTPHTIDCIGKIQCIQRDVLDLMGAIDKFNGVRGDREYMYIDEMLTRNLLKLDTIDTNGRDNIRMARKEAIRCIQASITVLEGKAEQNAAANKPPNELATGGANPTESLEQNLANFESSSNTATDATPNTPKKVSELKINIQTPPSAAVAEN